jgi:signal transduction histidine kinase/ActR/RegA family two-component response regulator
MPRTLRAQLILASAATLVLMSGLLLWGAQSAMRAALQEQFEHQLDVVRPLLVAALAPLMAARDHAAVHEVVRQSVSLHGLAFLEVLDADGRIVAATTRPAGESSPLNGTTSTEASLELEGQSYGQVRFGVRTEGLEAGLYKVTRNSLLIGALVLGLGLVLMVGITTWLTAHLGALAQASRRMAQGETMAPIPTGAGPSELRQLAQAFNQMTQALQERLQALEEGERNQRALVDALEELNTELEDRVAHRTAELEAARDAAEQANRAKSDFLSRMSHELRTPLNAVLGFAQVLRARSQELPAHAAEPLRHIEAAGWHLLEMINEVLDLARIESGRMSVSLESVDLAELLQQALQAAEPVARRKGIKLSADLALPAPCWVHADRTRTRQVIDNLLSNAVKYNRPQGEVMARLEPGAHGRVAVSITDTGRGLSADQLERLFEPFTRFVAPGEGIEGTGIGLLITKRLVEAMGGLLSVQSQPGVGSCFRFELAPASAPTPAVRAPEGTGGPVAAAAPQRTRTVVYVEDNPSNVAVFRQVLGLRPGIELLTAGDGVTGLALVRAHRPDLVVIDIDLPGMDGLELCRRLRADPQTSRIPLVALSANAMPRDIERGREAGFVAYLTKPMDVPALIAQLDHLLPDS